MSREETPRTENSPSEPQTSLTLLTINLLSGAARWELRRELLARQVLALAPDIIAVQEVSRTAAEPDPAAWLAKRIGYAHAQVCWQPSGGLGDEAVGLISRIPLAQPECLELDGQQRVALRAEVRLGGGNITVATTHLYWQPGDSQQRLRQAQQLLEWLLAGPQPSPCILAGDFNGSPETRAIRYLAAACPSAYASAHGREPDYTFPTPLKRSRRGLLLGMLKLLPYLRPQHFRLRLKHTLDYIFVDPRLRVTDCRLTLDQPDPHDPELYPSDHYGLLAKIRIM